MNEVLTAPKNGAVLGLDLGTSAVKCVVVAKGRILATAFADLDLHSPRAGWSEQDPDAWRAAVTEAIGSACEHADIDRYAIVGIGLSGQMHGAVALDETLRPLRPAILWNDNRSTRECSELEQAVPEIGEIAGIGALPGFTAPKLMWMRRHEPNLFGKIRKILLPKDFLALWLTGEVCTDRSDAAGTLWLDQKARSWSPRLIEASGIEADWLPPLKDGFEPVGRLRAEVAKTLGLSPRVTVFAGGGDAATGAVALGAAAAGRCMMSLGTSGQLLIVDGDYSPDPTKFVHAFCHTVPDTWFRMAAMLNGARPLAWFAKVIGVTIEEMLIRSQDADPTRIPLFLPFLTGERSPHGDPHIRAGFYGLEDGTGDAEMARAVVEAVAFSMADALDSFGADTKLTAPIPVIGGGSQSTIVLQSLADAMALPVARAGAGQGGAALGAALLAEVGSGYRSQGSLAFSPAIELRVDPQNNAGMQERLRAYQELYRVLRPYAARE